jgi:hypothetical protein
MMKIDVEAQDSFARIHSMLQDVPRGIERAMYGVISRATTTAKTTSLQDITTVYDIKGADVRDRKNTTINVVTKTVDDGVIGVVSYSGGKIPLIRFGVTPKYPRQGATVKVRQRKDSPMTTLNNAFIARMSNRGGNDHVGIFERRPGEFMKKRRGRSKHSEMIGQNKRGRGKNPDQFYGSSTPEMASNAVVLERVEAATMETIQKRTEAEITGYGG